MQNDKLVEIGLMKDLYILLMAITVSVTAAGLQGSLLHSFQTCFRNAFIAMDTKHDKPHNISLYLYQ